MRTLLRIFLGLGIVVALALGIIAAVLYFQGGSDLVSEVVSSAVLFVQGGSEHPSEAISAPGLTAADNATVFSIVAEESEVRFIIDEVLNGADFTVVGATDQVAGDISVNQGNPAASDIGVIRINARTLATNNGNRNRALRTFILKSGQDEYEFAEFEPQELTGLPQGVTSRRALRVADCWRAAHRRRGSGAQL